MVVKKLILTLRKYSHVDDSVRRHSHSVQRRGVCHGRNNHQIGVLEADETTIKEMILVANRCGTESPTRPSTISANPSPRPSRQPDSPRACGTMVGRQGRLDAGARIRPAG